MIVFLKKIFFVKPHGIQDLLCDFLFKSYKSSTRFSKIPLQPGRPPLTQDTAVPGSPAFGLPAASRLRSKPSRGAFKALSPLSPASLRPPQPNPLGQGTWVLVLTLWALRRGLVPGQHPQVQAHYSF